LKEKGRKTPEGNLKRRGGDRTYTRYYTKEKGMNNGTGGIWGRGLTIGEGNGGAIGASYKKKAAKRAEMEKTKAKN